MSYKLFIDDERFPVENSGEWVIVRSSQQAISEVYQKGMPSFISFDHDLGGDDTSMKFLRWLLDELLDDMIAFPEGFGYYVHSQNPVGAENIRSFMEFLIWEFGDERAKEVS